MKTPLYSKKGQYAVPVILIGTAALFLFYLIMVYPSEKAKILGSDIIFNESEEKITESPLGKNTTLIFSSGELSEVGRTAGQTVFDFPLKGAVVEYPAIPKTLDSIEGVIMKASVFTSDVQQFAASNINLENTKEVVVHMVVSEAKGTPKIVIFLNETKIYEKSAAPGEYNIRIKPGLLKETDNPIFVKVQSAGFSVIQQDSVTFERISIDQYYYDFTKAVTTPQTLNIQQSNYRGSTAQIKFGVADSITTGDLIIKIGQPGMTKKIVWSGSPQANQTVIALFPLENIMIGDNEIVFEAEKDGAYKIENVSIQFIAEATPAASKTYSFDVEQEDLYTSHKIILGIKVDRIIEPGYLFFTIAPSATSYYFP